MVWNFPDRDSRSSSCKLRWAGEVINQTRTTKDYVILLDLWRAGFRATSQKDALRFRAAVAGWYRFLIVHIPNRLTHNTQILNIVLEAFGGEHYLRNLWPAASTVTPALLPRAALGPGGVGRWGYPSSLSGSSRLRQDGYLRQIHETYGAEAPTNSLYVGLSLSPGWMWKCACPGAKRAAREKGRRRYLSENEEIWTNLTNRPNISASSARVTEQANDSMGASPLHPPHVCSLPGLLPDLPGMLAGGCEDAKYPRWTLNLGAWPWKEGRRLYTESGSEAKCQDGLPAELSWNPGGHGYAVTSRNLYAAGRELRGPKARLKKIRWWFEGDENVGWFTQSARRSVADGVHCEYTLLCILAFLLGNCSGAMRRPGLRELQPGDEIGISLMSVVAKGRRLLDSLVDELRARQPPERYHGTSDECHGRIGREGRHSIMPETCINDFDEGLIHMLRQLEQ
ncbi:uncharacterized protein CLUP02_09031 [Colletotrichum lupini]|uniref:Uncharacterized protein n=1 Tax=Colletotrichum lupini TaxID=145971 RepID=A0A9Q8SVT5_9PEZI|nr:uncharacterized protein CLUP02_09031 [Colletotrichum lupini]UQC83537.1 hypothetical protein CLUP02_09031 [Colletotrichum lupini]